MKIEFLVDDRTIKLRLATVPATMQAALVKKLTAIALRLERHIKEDKLSGQVLNVQTGALRRSIFSTIEARGDYVVATVASSSDVKYGRIHEFGGTIHVPEIVPVKAQALHFIVGGKDVFARRVRAHDVNMPERSFMRSALTDMRDEIVADIRKTVEELE
jgi:phage gpG-like protein